MPASWIPAEPPAPPDHHARGRVHLRFEDVSQDGRLVLEAMPHAFGTVWRQLNQKPPAAFEPGVLSIMSRLVMEGGLGPLSVTAAAEVEGIYHLAHSAGPDGRADRIILAMWCSVLAPTGHTHGPPPPDAGRILVAGRVFAEHVFTRPFAPPAERRIRTLTGIDGQPFVPEARHVFSPPESALVLPEGATWLDPAPVRDEVITVLGLDHTDSNLHVNSLVYPRLIIEAALRRFHALGMSTRSRLARGLEIAFRKPCFAGDRAQVTVQAFAWGDRVGVTAAISADGDTEGGRPRCAARIVFDG